MSALRFVRSLTLAAIGLLAWVAPTHAQDKSTYYTVRNPGEFTINWKAFYDRADALTAQARRDLDHTLDLSYGGAAKQKLDVYAPRQKPSGAAVLVFLHGGGFREGDRAHYGYVAVPFAAHGIVTVVPSYRLTPEGRFPDQPEDVRAVLRWIANNITTYGGDPKRVYLAGHSAGAILTATVCVDPSWRRGLGEVVVRGCIPISGSYDMRNLQGTPGYVGSPSQAEAASPVINVKADPPPTLVALGFVEERYLAPSRALVDALREKGGRADIMVLEGQAHDRTAAALGDEQGTLVQAILELIRDTRN
jgi:acetyl esterase/lipase